MPIFKITEENKKWWILVAMTTATAMIFVDMTVLPVALPTLQRDLTISDVGLQWVVNVYTLALAAFVLAGGKLGDMWGMRRVFCFGAFLFAFASALCGISYSEGWIIGSRALQGIGGAILLPTTSAVVYSNFPPHQRGKAVGIMVTIGMVFLAIGPLIGGSLTQYLSWRYVFWINLPIAGLGILLAMLVVPYSKGKREKFDFIGFFTLSIGISALVVALMESQTWGWSSPYTLSLLLLGVALPIILFKVERKIHHPIVDVALVLKRAFFSGSACIFCNQFLVMVGVFWAIYFQEILSFSPTKAGLYSFIANAPVLFAPSLGGYLVDRYGPRVPVRLGFSLIAFALFWFVFISPPAHNYLLFFTLIPFGFGIPLVFTPCFVSIMNEVPAEKRGSASGIINALRQFGATLGLAILGSIFTHQKFHHLGQYLKQNPGTQNLAPLQFEGILSHSPLAMKALNKLPTEQAEFVLAKMKASFISAFATINLISAIVALIGLTIAWRFLKNHPIHHEQN